MRTPRVGQAHDASGGGAALERPSLAVPEAARKYVWHLF
jgi:hypothetical protein